MKRQTVRGKLWSPKNTPSVFKSSQIIHRRIWYPIFEPSSEEAIRKMLDLAEVALGESVYDIGCGEGAILLEALNRGAQVTGVDYRPLRVKRARERVGNKGEIVHGDIFEDRFWSHKGNANGYTLHDANIVTMFLDDEMNAHLRPLFEHELRDGTRVVSNYWPMVGWRPVGIVDLNGNQSYHKIFLYRVPDSLPYRSVRR